MNWRGDNLALHVFGASHSEVIGMTLEGIPAGERIDLALLQHFLDRRAPGRTPWSTPRKEPDAPVFVSGLCGERADGSSITAEIHNQDRRSKDYSALAHTPRPGHADYPAAVKYGSAWNGAGGGAFSGRMTAPVCIAGGICLQLLEREGISVISRISKIGKTHDVGELTSSTAEKAFPVVNENSGKAMIEHIMEAKADGDSLGGVVECKIAGFEAARLLGSENNDPFRLEEGGIVTESNHAGGILGGITNGMPLVFHAAFKPTPSIAKPQRSVDLERMEETELRVPGRHDPCVVPRAVPVVEAMAALAVYDALLSRRKELEAWN